eukprot:356823-Chlamydomonas_euryale.AAC.2
MTLPHAAAAAALVLLTTALDEPRTAAAFMLPTTALDEPGTAALLLLLWFSACETPKHPAVSFAAAARGTDMPS